MPIVPSRSGRIHELLGRLGSQRPAERDSAVAGLLLLGPRAIEPLRGFLTGAEPSARLAALEVLEGLEDRGAVPLLLDLARDSDRAIAARALEAVGGRGDRRAVGALSELLEGKVSLARRRAAALALARLQAVGIVEALEPLAARLLDAREDAGLRAAILDALLGLRPPLSPSALRPLLKRLSASSDPSLAARAAAALAPPRGAPRAPRIDAPLVSRLLRPNLTAEEAERVGAALARRGAPAIPELVAALESLGPIRREPAGASSMRTRAAIHGALAALGSRVALHDLREALEARPPEVLPGLLRAAGRVGDASLVATLARIVSEDEALLAPCVATLSEIRAREGLRRTRTLVRAVRPPHRRAFDTLWERTRPARRA